jgi:ferredoxin-type protein NapF
VASRRDFLTAFKKPLERVSQRSEEHIVRPPYGLDESLFQERCSECETKACAPVCEEQIIVIRADGTPMLNFTKKGCTFCEACALACEAEVLSLGYSQYREKINAEFIITPHSCVAHNGVICFACKEPCIEDAILFNGLFNPVIDMDLCTACGYCEGRCPTHAISHKGLKISEES